MRVAHRDDYDTHAVIGGREIEAFGIAQTAEFFTVLSDTLYSNKPLAVAREVLCNAWDAHIASGRTHIPVVVTTNDDQLVIKDSGYGIPHELIHSIYCVYGNSTKENDGRQTGGFGLGSKSPFAYSDHFTVDNRHAGKRVVHAISRGSAKTQGKPDRRVMVEVPTKDEGVTVSIPLKTAMDAALFANLLGEIASYGDMNVLLNGRPITPMGLDKAEDNLYLTTHDNFLNASGTDILVRYGNVLYPVRDHEEIAKAFKAVSGKLDDLPSPYQYGSASWKAVLLAPPNSISVTPSRESLAMTETTCATLNALLTDLLPKIDTKGETLKAQIMAHQDRAVDQLWRRGQPHLLFTARNIVNDDLTQSDYYGNRAVVITNKDHLALFLAAKEQEVYRNGDFITEQDRRAQSLLDSGYPRKDELVWFRKERTKKKKKLAGYNLWKPYRKRFINRLVSRLHNHEILKHKHLYIRFDNHYNNTDDVRKGYVLASLARPHGWQILPLLQGIMIVAYSKQNLNESWDSFVGTLKLDRTMPVLTYLSPRSPKHREAAVTFFRKMGYLVLDHGAWWDAAEIAAAAREKAFRDANPSPVATPAVLVKAPPRPKGLPLLRSLLPDGKYFDPRGHLREEGKNPNMVRSVKPEAVMQPSSLSGRDFQHRFFPWGDSSGETIVKLFGDRIGVAATYKSVDKYMVEGARRGEDLIAEVVSAYMLSSPGVRGYSEKKSSNFDPGVSTIYDRLCQISKYSEVISSLVPQNPEMTKEDNQYYDIFYKMADWIGRKTSREPKDNWGKVIWHAMREMESWKTPPAIEAFFYKIQESEKLKFLEIYKMLDALERMERKKRVDYGLKTYIEISVVNALS